MRYEKDEENIVGHYARFKLLSGFEKCDYMTKEEVFAHAKKYSKSYQYDLRDGKKTSKWSTDWVPMGNKTVLLRLLTKYGIMSIEMQDAIKADYQTDFRDAQNAIDDTIEMQTGSVVIDADFEQSQLQSQQAGK
jgi:recombination protein RecT